VTTSRRRLAQRRREKDTGSPFTGEPVFLVVGIARRPHGLRGEVLVSVETDFPERLTKGAKLFLGEEHTPVTVASTRGHNEGLLITFEEFPDKASVEFLRNTPLFVSAEDRPPLPDGEYYQHQLLGMQVFEESGELLGTLEQVLDTGANNVYVVRDSEGKELLLPAIKNVVRQILPAEKKMVVHLLPGLRDLSK
jgi:16S rRNA processing protein RimM